MAEETTGKQRADRRDLIREVFEVGFAAGWEARGGTPIDAGGPGFRRASEAAWGECREGNRPLSLHHDRQCVLCGRAPTVGLSDLCNRCLTGTPSVVAKENRRPEPPGSAENPNNSERMA